MTKGTEERRDRQAVVLPGEASACTDHEQMNGVYTICLVQRLNLWTYPSFPHAPLHSPNGTNVTTDMTSRFRTRIIAGFLFKNTTSFEL